MIPSLRRRSLLLGATGASLLAACGGSDSLGDRIDIADPKIRFVHAVPGGPDVTLQRNGVSESGATNVPYKYASQYYDVGTANYVFSLRRASGNVELATVTLNAERGNRYTLVAVLSGTGVELLVIRDPYNKSVASDNARLRVLDTAVNATAFDVYVTAQGAALAGETADLVGIGYNGILPPSGGDSIEIEGGVYQLRLTPTGSKTPFFDAAVSVPKNGDWLLVALPRSAAPNSVLLLLVRSDDTADATDEITG